MPETAISAWRVMKPGVTEQKQTDGIRQYSGEGTEGRTVLQGDTSWILFISGMLWEEGGADQ